MVVGIINNQNATVKGVLCTAVCVCVCPEFASAAPDVPPEIMRVRITKGNNRPTVPGSRQTNVVVFFFIYYDYYFSGEEKNSRKPSSTMV